MAKFWRTLLIIAAILGVLFVLYKILTKDEEFDDFEDDFDFEDDYDEDDGIIGKITGAVKGLFA